MAQFPPTPPEGRYFVPGAIAEAKGSTDFQLVNGRIYYMPFRVSRKVSVDKLAVRVGGTSTEDYTIRCGIYQADATTQMPSTLLIETVDMDLNVALGTVVEKTITATDLSPGVQYYCGLIAKRDTGVGDSQITSFGIGTAGFRSLGGATAAAALDSTADPVYMQTDNPGPGWASMPNPADLTSIVFQGLNVAPAVAVHILSGKGAGPGAAPLIIPMGTADKRWWVPARIDRTGNTFKTLAAGTVYYYPFHALFGSSLSGIALQDQFGGASGVVRVGLYTERDGSPDVLLASTAEISLTGSGATQIGTLGLTLSQNVTYWIGFGCKSGTPSLRALVAGNKPPTMTHLGWGTAVAALDGTNADIARVESGLGAFTALPNPAAPTTFDNVSIPTVALEGA